MKPNEISEKMAERKGQLTPRALLIRLLEAVDRGEIETLVYATREINGQVETGYSETQQLEVLGLLECAKHNTLGDMSE